MALIEAMNIYRLEKIMIRTSKTELNYWFNEYVKWLREFECNFMTQKKYCKREGLDFTKFLQMVARFNPWNGKYKNEKEREKKLAEDYKKYEKGMNSFCELHNVNQGRLSKIVSWYNYQSLLGKKIPTSVDELEEEKISMDFKEVLPFCASEQIPRESINNYQENFPENRPMEIEEIKPNKSKPQEGELIKEQNDLELIIKKGVKVTVSPNIGAEQLIKIIELLKDL